MGIFLKYLFYLLVLIVLGVVGNAIFSELPAPQHDVVVPITAGSNQ